MTGAGGIGEARVLADVVYAATLAMCDGIANEPAARRFSADIARAVAAHLLDKEQLHKARAAVSKSAGCTTLTPCWFDDSCSCWRDARAALQAAIGEVKS